MLESERPQGAFTQFVRFLIVGGGATLVQYLAFGLGLRITDGSATVVSSVAYLLGSIVSYALNYTFTFASEQPHRRVVPKFYLMVLSGWLLNTALMAFMTGRLEMNAWLAQALATMTCLVWNFLVSRIFVFGDKS
ncbi:GtrA family protein [Variovorax boronicumulans]|uniref:GtrA family protein n=1 Tax=Variovorax boronicumulans TaxID=436515 RepID=UPI001C55B8B3